MATSIHLLYLNVKLLNSPSSVQSETETDIDAMADESFDQYSLTFVLPRFTRTKTSIKNKLKKW